MRRLMLPALLPALLVAAPPRVKEMALTTPDGYALKGTLTVPAAKGRRPVVVLAHQFRANREGWGPLVEQLHARGIATLALDLRGHGASATRNGEPAGVSDDFFASAEKVGFARIPDDLGLAVRWLRTQGGVDASRLGLAGSSVGAFSVVLASPKVKPTAVLSLSPAGAKAFGSEARTALAKAAADAHAPLMVFASDQDEDAATNAAALKAIPGISLHLREGRAHGFDYLAKDADTMAVFFAVYLKGPRYQAAPKAEAPAEAGKEAPSVTR